MADNPTIKQGSQGAAVKKAQKRLIDRGYAPLTADGIFGGQTRNRVRNFQPLAVDGIVGPKTWARLDPPTIKKGADGNSVKLLQTLLGEFGFPTAVDGDFGPNTETALKDFQTFWGTLVVDGIAGPLTWTALWS
jgi:peptidoglycan hydrolase-like protein with peptidoglycan-binding domain